MHVRVAMREGFPGIPFNRSMGGLTPLSWAGAGWAGDRLARTVMLKEDVGASEPQSPTMLEPRLVTAGREGGDPPPV